MGEGEGTGNGQNQVENKSGVARCADMHRMDYRSKVRSRKTISDGLIGLVSRETISITACESHRKCCKRLYLTISTVKMITMKNTEDAPELPMLPILSQASRFY